MTAGYRSTLTLSSLMLLGFAAVMVVHFFFGGSGPQPMEWHAAAPATRAVSQPTTFDPPTVASQAPSVATRAPPKTAQARATPHIARSLLGEASGKIHFEGTDEDLQPQSSIGVWLSSQNILRIALFESPPQAANLAELLDAIRSGNLHTVAERAAYIDLHFSSAAQAFDNNAVDSARLTAISGAYLNTANAFNSLDWQGRLPAPEQVPPDGPMPKISLKASRESLDTDDEPGRPSWQLSLNAPVIVRD